MPSQIQMRDRREHQSGPASRTLFSVDGDDQVMEPRFWAELSSAYSQMFFLQQHALVSSVSQGVPVLTFFDRESYLRACQLYPPNISPLDDLDSCQLYPVQRWRQIYEQANVI